MGRARKIPIIDDKPKTTRKRKNAKKEEEITEVKEENVIIQLPIKSEKVYSILKENDIMLNPLEYMPNLLEPAPYVNDNYFESANDILEYEDNNNMNINDTFNKSNDNNDKVVEKLNNNTNCCYWCCHSIGPKEFGMPIKYDTIHKTFTVFGSFCSLECVVAYNYSINMGSDRMWEIHSWIQWIGKKIGYELPIRPAPNKYLLKMFNGPLDIEEFRNIHNSYLKTCIMNMPPLIHIQGQMETVNTSFVNKAISSTINSEHVDNKNNNEKVVYKENVKLSRKKEVMDMKNTLDSKMNLTIKHIK